MTEISSERPWGAQKHAGGVFALLCYAERVPGCGSRGEEGDMQIHVHSLRDFLKDAYRRVADSAFYAADFGLSYATSFGQFLLREILALPGLDHSAHESSFGLKLVASLSEFRVEEP